MAIFSRKMAIFYSYPIAMVAKVASSAPPVCIKHRDRW